MWLKSWALLLLADGKEEDTATLVLPIAQCKRKQYSPLSLQTLFFVYSFQSISDLWTHTLLISQVYHYTPFTALHTAHCALCTDQP